MTRDQFIYALTACGCLLKDGKTWYEHNELIKCFEDLGLFEQEPILDKLRAEIEPKCDRINSLASVLPYTAHREIQELLCDILDLCKAESEE